MKTLLLAIPFIFFFIFAAPTASIASSTGQSCSLSQACPSGFTCDNLTNGTCVPVSNVTNSTQQSTNSNQQCANGGTGLCNPLKINSIQGLLTAILSFVVRIGTIIIVLMLVITGFRFVLARGNPAELSKAKNMLMWTLIGALIILGAQAISVGIQSTISAISATP